MKIERAILIAFLGNYLVNNVVAAIAAFVPAGTGTITAQYVTFVVLAAILVAIVTWWYFRMAPASVMAGLWFGILGFVTSIVVAFITGVSGVLVQTASFSTLFSVLPNFWPFLWSVSTLVLLGYWVIPAVLIGWLKGGRGARAMPQSAGSTSMPQRSM
ncbi:MAG TPA: hypothetical protein VG102_02400 [Candidatus Paceibacterota bacterium]|jgi:hypothetical protein|nr:hypothetical protein [Candidatus Paceibacterota bacterium]